MLCTNCMKGKINENGVCSSCGKRENEQERNSRYLPLRTILKGKYLVGKVVGEGGFGITYIGFDLDLEIRVAIKEYFPREYACREVSSGTTLIPYNSENKEFYQKEMSKFIDEAKRLAKLRNYEGIVPVLDYFIENETAYIVMEYIEGTTLKQFIKTVNRPMSIESTLHVAMPIIRVLQKVHEEGIIHRDISPDNIMISSNYEKIYLIDFGTSRNVTYAEEHSLSVYKKSSYTPPEQQNRRGNQGPWTDVYALCATMYYCLTGALIPEAMERVMGEQIKRPSQMGVAIGEDYEDILMKGLEVHFADRFQSMVALEKALCSAREEESNKIENVVTTQALKDIDLRKEINTVGTENTKTDISLGEVTNRTEKNRPNTYVKRWIVMLAIVLGVVAIIVGFTKTHKRIDMGTGILYYQIKTLDGKVKKEIKYKNARVIRTRCYRDVDSDFIEKYKKQIQGTIPYKYEIDEKQIRYCYEEEENVSSDIKKIYYYEDVYPYDYEIEERDGFISVRLTPMCCEVMNSSNKCIYREEYYYEENAESESLIKTTISNNYKTGKHQKKIEEHVPKNKENYAYSEESFNEEEQMTSKYYYDDSGKMLRYCTYFYDADRKLIEIRLHDSNNHMKGIISDINFSTNGTMTLWKYVSFDNNYNEFKKIDYYYNGEKKQVRGFAV